VVANGYAIREIIMCLVTDWSVDKLVASSYWVPCRGRQLYKFLSLVFGIIASKGCSVK